MCIRLHRMNENIMAILNIDSLYGKNDNHRHTSKLLVHLEGRLMECFSIILSVQAKEHLTMVMVTMMMTILFPIKTFY